MIGKKPLSIRWRPFSNLPGAQGWAVMRGRMIVMREADQLLAVRWLERTFPGESYVVYPRPLATDTVGRP